VRAPQGRERITDDALYGTRVFYTAGRYALVAWADVSGHLRASVWRLSDQADVPRLVNNHTPLKDSRQSTLMITALHVTFSGRWRALDRAIWRAAVWVENLSDSSRAPTPTDVSRPAP
jgi:hypothetical protein